MRTDLRNEPTYYDSQGLSSIVRDRHLNELWYDDIGDITGRWVQAAGKNVQDAFGSVFTALNDLWYDERDFSAETWRLIWRNSKNTIDTSLTSDSVSIYASRGGIVSIAGPAYMIGTKDIKSSVPANGTTNVSITVNTRYGIFNGVYLNAPSNSTIGQISTDGNPWNMSSWVGITGNNFDGTDDDFWHYHNAGIYIRGDIDLKLDLGRITHVDGDKEVLKISSGYTEAMRAGRRMWCMSNAEFDTSVNTFSQI